MVERRGIGLFVIHKGEASLLNKLKDLKVPVTIFREGDRSIVNVKMGYLDPGEYRVRCERVAAVIQGDDSVPRKDIKKNKSEILKTALAVVTTLAFFVIFWFV
jgi:hypothetical protein